MSHESSVAEPRRCPLCSRREHGSSACFPASSNTYVPAPEQQGDACPCLAGKDDPIHHDRSLEHFHAFNAPVEQQEEPVCARCGHPEFAQDGSAVHISEREQDGGDDSDDWCVMCANEKRQIWGHHFEPAPPPSEEAEDRAWGEFWDAQHDEDLNPDDDYFAERAEDATIRLRAAIRRHIEEELRVALANQDRLAAVLDMGGQLDQVTGRAERAEEERDRLRERVMEAVVELEEASEDRRELEEALRAAERHAEHWRREHEAAEAQVQELRAALENIVHEWFQDNLALDEINDAVTVLRAPAAHQEEGETK